MLEIIFSNYFNSFFKIIFQTFLIDICFEFFLKKSPPPPFVGLFVNVGKLFWQGRLENYFRRWEIILTGGKIILAGMEIFWQVGKLFWQGRWENYSSRWEKYFGRLENCFGGLGKLAQIPRQSEFVNHGM